MNDKIDFVITWVDGTDANWLEKKKKYTQNNVDLDTSNVRYRDYGTLKFFFRSVERYAPWVHKIYLITDNQVPAWLNLENSKVKVIDHTDFIDDKYLPLFNSNAIEWNMDKIPNLSNTFVYFNDDIVINRAVKAEDFFLNGKPRDFRLYTDIIPTEEFVHIVLNNDILINSFVKNRWPVSNVGLWSIKYRIKRLKNLIFLPQIKKSGIVGYIEPHGPMAFTKSAFKKAKSIWKIPIEETTSHRFRSLQDVSIWLVRHLQLETGNFVPINDGNNYFNDIRHLDEIKEYLLKKKSNTICINDIDSDDYLYESIKLNKILSKKFPQKSAFEK